MPLVMTNDRPPLNRFVYVTKKLPDCVLFCFHGFEERNEEFLGRQRHFLYPWAAKVVGVASMFHH